MKVILRIEKMEGWSESEIIIPKNRLSEYLVGHLPEEDFLNAEILDIKTRKTLCFYDKKEGLC